MNGSLFFGKLVNVWVQSHIPSGTSLPEPNLSYPQWKNLPDPPPPPRFFSNLGCSTSKGGLAGVQVCSSLQESNLMATITIYYRIQWGKFVLTCGCYTNHYGNPFSDSLQIFSPTFLQMWAFLDFRYRWKHSEKNKTIQIFDPFFFNRKIWMPWSILINEQWGIS